RTPFARSRSASRRSTEEAARLTRPGPRSRCYRQPGSGVRSTRPAFGSAHPPHSSHLLCRRRAVKGSTELTPDRKRIGVNCGSNNGLTGIRRLVVGTREPHSPVACVVGLPDKCLLFASA